MPNAPLFVVTASFLLGLLRLVKPPHLLFVFFLSGFVNGSLENFNGYAFYRYVLLIPILLQVTQASVIKRSLSAPFFVFFAYLICHSFVISPSATYSFVNALVALVTVFAGLSVGFSKNADMLIEDYVVIGTAIALLSVMSITSPDFSYARNGTGLQGFGTHPNIFGVFMAPLAFYFFATFLRRLDILTLLAFIFFFVLVVLSQSRTAVFSIIIAIFYYLLFSSYRLKRILLLFFLFSPLIIFTVNYSAGLFVEIFADILTKGAGDSDSFVNSVERSRGALFFGQLTNIQNNPIFGIGFKISSSGEANSLFSAASTENSYEKGVFLLALLEETGLVGLMIFFIFIYQLLGHTIFKRYSLPLFFVPICFLVTTFGEASLLSVGSNGPLIWAFIAASKRHVMEFD
jgi:hypothetical protein